ncbi:hypothetical protein DOTSEDRAFT_21368 [Dothistroma septosporum NZE10]|uniref:Uncharacterized protein n=1 Tax=Dothistroma septosporum (strain NZE10 / CBS 128990) TaxID=675120 RepID=N1PW46_DOTSN|nr:hypothetical protein DOTSEDRAFT_21368 [Dothistroma septosporum NZE10]
MVGAADQGVTAEQGRIFSSKSIISFINRHAPHTSLLHNHQLNATNSTTIVAESLCPSAKALDDLAAVQQQPRPDILATTNHPSYTSTALMASTTPTNNNPYAYQKPSTLATRNLVSGETPVDRMQVNHYEDAVRAAGQSQPKNDTTGKN